MCQGATVKYIIREDGFVYHTRKGILKAGSTIAKGVHPISEVETLKQQLLQKRALKNIGSHYLLTRNVETGLLMAYNLHCGYLIKDLPTEHVVIINGKEEEDESIKQAFWFKGLKTAGNEFIQQLDKESFRIIKIMRAKYDADFFKGTQKIGISREEQFVADALVAVGELSSYRRGDEKAQEADLVDEDQGRQIEIVRFLDEKIPDQVRYKRNGNQELSLLAEYINMNYNKVPKGVIKKFTEKTYTDKYSKELAIYMLGTQETAIDKIQELRGELESKVDQIKNQFTNIHFIIHDPFMEQSFTFCNRNMIKTLSDKKCRTNLIELDPVNEKDVVPEESYFLMRENIFTGSKDLTLMTGEELLEYGLLK